MSPIKAKAEVAEVEVIWPVGRQISSVDQCFCHHPLPASVSVLAYLFRLNSLPVD